MSNEHSKMTVILKNSQNAVHFFGQQQQLLLVSVKNEKQFFNFIFLAEAYHPFSAFFDVILSDKWQKHPSNQSFSGV